MVVLQASLVVAWLEARGSSISFIVCSSDGGIGYDDFSCCNRRFVVWILYEDKG
jgi:hypothetical protein